MSTAPKRPATSAMASDSSPTDKDLGQEESQESQIGNQPTKTSRQRFKPQLSCTLCRNRKLKCDRQLPCGNCTKRGATASCTFVHGNLREKLKHVSKSNSLPRDVQSQIQHLEELVISMMNRASKLSSKNPDSGTQPTSESLDLTIRGSHTPEVRLSAQQIFENNLSGSAETFGQISIEDNQSNYVGHSHWTAILDNIAGLKDSLEITEPVPQEPISGSDLPGPDLLLGSIPRASRAEILAALPPRPIADALVEVYLSMPDMGSTAVHKPTFRKEFERFWTDPGQTPIMWIGLLYSLLSMATICEQMSGLNTLNNFKGHVLLDQAEAVDLFRQKTVQCLILGNYTEPDKYTITTLIYYYVTEHFRSADTQFGTWMVFGMIIRAAMRLGYHRDASHQPKISVHQAEMQRRLWDIILFFDLQTSLQVGLPRMLREGTYDTQAPRNFLDEDFSGESTVLPPSRPEHDITPVGYSNIKHRVTKILGRIVDQSNSTTPIPYQEIMLLDQQLHYEQAKTPRSLTIQTIEDLRAGMPDTRLRKFYIDLTFQKSRCVLHRKYLFPNKSTGTYPHPYSVKTCVDASMRVLQAQVVMYSERQSGKDLYSHTWKSSSLITHDFLLAAMLICLYVRNSLTIKFPDQETLMGTDIRIEWSREDMLTALEGSYEIWSDLRATSKEATKAAKTLKGILERVRRVSSGSGVPVASKSAPSSQLESHVASNTQFSSPDYSNQPSVSSSSSWANASLHLPPNETAGGNNDFQTASLTALPMGTTNPSLDFDWELWDNHFQPQNLADTPPELWNFDLDPSLTDPTNSNFMQWDQTQPLA